MYINLLLVRKFYIHIFLIFFIPPIGSLVHESKKKYHRRPSAFSFFQGNRNCYSAPGLLRCRSLNNASFTYIKSPSSTQESKYSPRSSPKTTSQEKTMLICQQKPIPVNNNEIIEKRDNSIYITSSEAVAYVANAKDRAILIIDCGSPLRHAERRIQDSILLNVNDKISRRRLVNRGLKHFLNNNQVEQLDKSTRVILYDDFILRSSSSCANQWQSSSSMKFLYEEIKRYDTNKVINVLQSSFDEFYQQYPSLCYVSTTIYEDLSSPSPLIVKPLDIDSYRMCEVMPGLYLGSSSDAEDRHFLEQHQIRVIINISTSIPCYFENETCFEYIQKVSMWSLCS